MDYKAFQLLLEIQDNTLHLKNFIKILKDTIYAHDDNAYLWEFIDLIIDKAENLYNKLEDFQFNSQVSKEILRHCQDLNTCE